MTLRCTTLALLVLYVLLTIYPIVSIAAGVAPSRFLAPVSTLAGFTFALLHAGQREGWTRALRLLALVFAVSLLFESVGVATGLAFPGENVVAPCLDAATSLARPGGSVPGSGV